MPEGANEFMELGYSIVTPHMIRAMDTICKFLNLDFPSQDSGKHIAFQNVSMPFRKIIMLALVGVMWAVVIGAAGYLIATNFR
ncbi:hypothetical protein MKL09_18085 [Methylobacterium sp. J-048]|uniref:hypothetical protein n=1 Tax=Methylobacterium sp. J-048 TaxID=2836635 RepID=UPI001FBBA499|nr:hypothetical protein [Methylobacterium sp. J-048]MCJ2058452.1 hypothetical protein [Methylobacterium sp. J-048]